MRVHDSLKIYNGSSGSTIRSVKGGLEVWGKSGDWEAFPGAPTRHKK